MLAPVCPAAGLAAVPHCAARRVSRAGPGRGRRAAPAAAPGCALLGGAGAGGAGLWLSGRTILMCRVIWVCVGGQERLNGILATQW